MGFFDKKNCANYDNQRMTLGVEPLEDRQMLSGSVQPAVESSNFQLTKQVSSKIERVVVNDVRIDADKLVDKTKIKAKFGNAAGSQNLVKQTLGPGATAGKAQSTLGAIRSNAPSHSKNPLENQRSNFIGSPNSFVNADTDDGKEKDSSAWSSVTAFFSSVASSVTGVVGGTATAVLTANTDTPDGKKNEAEGIMAYFRLGKTGMSNKNALEMDRNNKDKTPNPDADESSGATIITQQQIDAIAARLGAASEYADEAGSKGGPVNKQKTTEGSNQQVGQWNPDVDRATSAISQYDARGIEARIDGMKVYTIAR